MPTETLPILAYEVREGDRIRGWFVDQVTLYPPCWAVLRMSGLQGVVRVPRDWPITVTRAVPDECQRGRMELVGDGTLIRIDGKILPHEAAKLVFSRVAQLWNDSEDDETQADEKWMVSEGWERIDSPETFWHHRSIPLALWNDWSFNLTIGPEAGRYLIASPATRGHVRRLCAAIGMNGSACR